MSAFPGPFSWLIMRLSIGVHAAIRVSARYSRGFVTSFSSDPLPIFSPRRSRFVCAAILMAPEEAELLYARRRLGELFGNAWGTLGSASRYLDRDSATAVANLSSWLNTSANGNVASCFWIAQVECSRG